MVWEAVEHGDGASISSIGQFLCLDSLLKVEGNCVHPPP